MDHAAAEDLDPALALAHAAALAAALKAAHVHFGGRLGVGEVVRAEAHARFFAVQLFDEKLQRAFQIAERHALIHHKAFALVENGAVCGVHRVGAVNAARGKHRRN